MLNESTTSSRATGTMTQALCMTAVMPLNTMAAM